VFYRASSISMRLSTLNKDQPGHHDLW
jgi:hypothetical protein